MDDLKIIKQMHGEKMSHLCRELFPTILETPGLLSKIITSKFAKNYYLYDDIVVNNLIYKFRDYIYMSEELLDKKYIEYSSIYTFGLLKNKTGRSIIDENSIDLVVLETNNNKYYLKRLYG